MWPLNSYGIMRSIPPTTTLHIMIWQKTFTTIRNCEKSYKGQNVNDPNYYTIILYYTVLLIIKAVLYRLKFSGLNRYIDKRHGLKLTILVEIIVLTVNFQSFADLDLTKKISSWNRPHHRILIIVRSGWIKCSTSSALNSNLLVLNSFGLS